MSQHHREKRPPSFTCTLQLLPPLPSDMKVSVAALAVLLIAICYQTSAAPVGSDPPTSCCFTYVSRQMPFNFVADYYETNSQCPLAGVVFITKKGREVCANPENDWVQDYMNRLELN
uniref:Chemokine interleukin-8-like domain-containing protein n=1 Tax=Chrysolophus pictus TaxID=9089 RepID=A0A8C3L847_CHRPC